jgi:uncharacterized damage-inducible protein DinB
MVRVETVLDSWQTVRKDAAQAVLDFPGDDLSFRPTEDLATFGEIARHILDAGHALTGLMLDGEDSMAGPDFREKLKKYSTSLPPDAPAASLAAEMNHAVEQRVSELRAQPTAFFEGEITRFDGQRVTRLEMLQFVKEHELTHRSQLFVYLRLKGVIPPTTRRKMAKK